MSKNDKKHFEPIQEAYKIHLINGEVSFVNVKNIVGFCNSITHRGYLTAALLKKHDCLNRKCSNFQKFSDFPYWVNRDLEEANKLKHKEDVNDKNKQKEKRSESIETKCATLLKTSQNIARKLGYPIKIVRVAPQRRANNDYTYIINYVSDFPFNDWYEYIQIVKDLSAFHRCRYYLRRLKLPNGRFAIISDIEKKK